MLGLKLIHVTKSGPNRQNWIHGCDTAHTINPKGLFIRLVLSDDLVCTLTERIYPHLTVRLTGTLLINHENAICMGDITESKQRIPIRWAYCMGHSIYVCWFTLSATIKNISWIRVFIEVLLYIRLRYVSRIRPQRNDRYFADNIFKYNFVSGNLIDISRKYARKGPPDKYIKATKCI